MTDRATSPDRRAPLAPLDFTLYGVTVFAWAFSWIAIHYQVGSVAPEVSVVWRFLLSAPLMMALARWRGERLAYPFSEHLRFAGLGLFLFCTNFVLFYYAAAHVASGLLSVVFSLASIVNVALGALVLGAPIDRRVALAGLCGAAGVGLMFYPQVADDAFDGDALIGLATALVGTLSFCTGNMLSARLQRRRIPVVAATAWAMFYGAIMLAGYAAVRGRAFVIDPDPVYLGALVYLALVATFIAFACYLTMLGRIGPDRAAYVTVVTPVIALLVSTFFEGYRWSPLAVVGLVAVLAGNLLVLRPRRR